jgi:hypothetical protein
LPRRRLIGAACQRVRQRALAQQTHAGQDARKDFCRRSRVLAHLACAIADGAEVISDPEMPPVGHGVPGWDKFWHLAQTRRRRSRDVGWVAG